MDFDDETFDKDGGTDGPDPPAFRATVQRSGAVRLVPWWPWVQSSGPAYTLMAARDRAGITIADLRVIRDDDGAVREVIIELHSGGSDTHRAALSDWAQAVGYRRVWFDDEVIDLQPSAAGPVTTRCPGCGQRYFDGHSSGFWQHVRRSGTFPWTCKLCGSDLDQWIPASPAHLRDAKPQTRTREPPVRAGKRRRR